MERIGQVRPMAYKSTTSPVNSQSVVHCSVSLRLSWFCARRSSAIKSGKSAFGDSMVRLRRLGNDTTSVAISMSMYVSITN